jgi:hypothetical protein
MTEQHRKNVMRIVEATNQFCLNKNCSVVIMAIIGLMAADFGKNFSPNIANDFMARNRKFTKRYPLIADVGATIAPDAEEIAALAIEMSQFWGTLHVDEHDVASAQYTIVRILWKQLHGTEAMRDWVQLVQDWTDRWHLNRSAKV